MLVMTCLIVVTSHDVYKLFDELVLIAKLHLLRMFLANVFALFISLSVIVSFSSEPESDQVNVMLGGSFVCGSMAGFENVGVILTPVEVGNWS